MIRLFAASGLAFAAACANGAVTAPFSYAEDRCRGGHNQCQAACTDLNDGPARAACIEQCLRAEDQCYASGDPGSALAVDSAVGAARSRDQKEADFQRWKAQKRRAEESAEKSQAGEQ